jgi:hypothetical protein
MAASTIGNYPEIWPALTWNAGIGVVRHGRKASVERLLVVSLLPPFVGELWQAIVPELEAVVSKARGTQRMPCGRSRLRRSAIAQAAEVERDFCLGSPASSTVHDPGAEGARDRDMAALWYSATSVADVNAYGRRIYMRSLVGAGGLRWRFTGNAVGGHRAASSRDR